MNVFVKSIIVFLLMLYSADSVAQDKYLDSVKTLTQSKTDTVRYWAYSELSWVLKETDKVKALEYSNRLLKEASETENLKWKAQGYNDLGIIYHGKGDLNKALENYENSLKIRKKLGYKKDIASSLSKIALVKTENAQYGEAIKLQLEVLKIYEELDIKPYINMTCNNIATLYSNIGSYTISNDYLKRAYKIETEIGNNQAMCITLATMGTNFSDMGKPDSAIVYLTKAKVLLKEFNELRSYAIACNNLGLAYRKNKNTAKGRENYLEAVKVSEEIGDSAGIILYSSNLANILIDEGKLNEAEGILLKCLEDAQKMKQGESVLTVISSLCGLYIQMKDADKADYYFDKYRSAKDSIFSNEAAKMYSEEQTKFDVAKKDLELKAQSEEIEKEKAQRNLTLAALGFFVLISAIATWAFIQKKKSNKIVQQKNLLLEHANEEISHQKEELSEKQKEILDSINYAQRIQNALLANELFLRTNGIDHFILFKPKDIVSGDFTWSTQKDRYIYLACCDSTGHGVPGAFMSLLSMGFLSEAIKERNIIEPGLIFNYVRDRLTETIGKGDQKDGFDGILVRIDTTNAKLVYAAAHNGPILIKKNQTIHLPVDKMPVGMGVKTDSFNTYEIDYQRGDILYMFTDGYPDQFGGPKGKKLKYKQLEDLLFDNHGESFEIQKKTLIQFFESWRGNLEQVDDVCIIGMRL